MKVHIARTSGNSCGCSSGGRITLTFPTGVTPAFMDECSKAGLFVDREMSKVGLLFLSRGPVTVSGSLCLKTAHLVCRGGEKECASQVAEMIAILESIFGKLA